jgi:hypothetical protein
MTAIGLEFREDSNFRMAESKSAVNDCRSFQRAASALPTVDFECGVEDMAAAAAQVC